MSRKNISVMIAVLMAAMLVLSACGGGKPATAPAPAEQPAGGQAEQPAPTEPAQSEQKGPWRIGVSNVSVVNPWRVQLIEEFHEAARNHPDLIKEIIVTDAGGDANKQIADVEDLLAQKVDALIITPASPTALVPVIEEAFDSGIPVILFSTDAETDKVTARVMPDYYGWAKQTADWLGQAMGGKGNLIALRGIAGLSAEADEWRGFDEMLAANPDIKLICTEFADWAYDKAKTAILNCLANNPEIHGIASLGDGMTWAAAEVLKANGYDITRIPMVGVGGSNGFMKLWQKEGLNAMVVADPTAISYTALMAALDALQGKEVPRLQAPETAVVTNDNLAQFVKPELPDLYFAGTKLSDATLKKIHGSN